MHDVFGGSQESCLYGSFCIFCLWFVAKFCLCFILWGIPFLHWKNGTRHSDDVLGIAWSCLRRPQACRKFLAGMPHQCIMLFPVFYMFFSVIFWRCVYAVSTAGFQYMRLCTGPDHAGFIGGPLPRVFHPGPSFAPRCSIGQRFYVGIKGCENKWIYWK